MKSLWIAASAALLAASAVPGRAQAPAELLNPQIEIAYGAPKTAKFAPIKERLERRRVLETFRQFMAPLQLPRKLVVKIDECGSVDVRSRQSGTVTICYEFIEEVRRLAPTGPVQLIQTVTNPRRLGPESAIVGPFVQALLHETAIAVFDMLDIPVLGRREDAADRVAALILLQFSQNDVAWNAIVGTAWFLAGSALKPVDLSDVRGTMAQRYYTILCIAFGADPSTFKTFVQRYRGGDTAGGDLPAQRAASCSDEYATLRAGFHKTIAPHLNGDLLRRVQDVEWINFFN